MGLTSNIRPMLLRVAEKMPSDTGMVGDKFCFKHFIGSYLSESISVVPNTVSRIMLDNQKFPSCTTLCLWRIIAIPFAVSKMDLVALERDPTNSVLALSKPYVLAR